jgi:RNA 3'-phosphate cyclase
MMGIKALKDMTGAKVEGLKEGSTCIEFHPGEIKAGQYQINIGTAGSTTLILQVLFLPSAFAPGKVELLISGGTDVKWSPPIDYVKNVTLPITRKMGYNADIELISRGYYPKGGGKIRAEVMPISNLTAVKITETGRLKGIEGVAHSLNLPCHIVERLAKSAKEALSGYECDIKLECGKNFSTGCGITLWAEFENTAIGASSLGEIGKPAEKVGREAGLTLLEEMKSEAPIDSHMGDQIIPYLALAEGTSKIVVHKPTSHLRTNIYITEKILQNKFVIKERENSCLIVTKGIGFKNSSL